MADQKIRSQAVIIGDNLIAASTGVTASSNHLILKEWEGWDLPPEHERLSTPRLFGDGDIYSKLTYHGSKTFSFRILADIPESSNVRIVRSQLMKVADRLNDTSTVAMVYYEGGKVVFKEVMNALPSSPFIEEWIPVNNTVEFAISFYAPNPWKTVYLNGSSTAESTKRL